jgi:hypothetical protein
MYNIYLTVNRFFIEDEKNQDFIVRVKGAQKWDKVVSLVTEISKTNPDNLYTVQNDGEYARKRFQGWWLAGKRYMEEDGKPAVTFHKRFKMSAFYTTDARFVKNVGYTHISHIEALAVNSNTRGYTPYIFIAEGEDGKKYYHYASKWIDEAEATSIMNSCVAREQAKNLWVIPKDVNNIGSTWELRLSTFQHKSLEGVARQLGTIKQVYNRVALIDGVSEGNATKLIEAAKKLQEAIDILNEE